MRIKKFFNNNSGLVELGDGKEAIVFGKGIGFNQKKNQKIDSKKIQKIFYLENGNEKDSFYHLLQNIPIDIVSTVFDIIENAQKHYNFKVYDSIYLTLSEHIYESYKLIVGNKYKENKIPNFKERYPTEYKLSAEALRIIEHNLHVKFPESEVKSIALHFINSKDFSSNEIQDIPPCKLVDTRKIVSVILNVLDSNNIYRTVSNTNSFNRFMVHLEYLVDRIRHPCESSASLDGRIKEDLTAIYPRSSKIAQEIFNALKTETNYKPSEAEITYFIIHIHRIIDQKGNCKTEETI